MDPDPLVVIEWRDDHALTQRSIVWIREHAAVDDPNPVATAVGQLRAAQSDRFNVS
jgi:hypothetical protein